MKKFLKKIKSAMLAIIILIIALIVLKHARLSSDNYIYPPFKLIWETKAKGGGNSGNIGNLFYYVNSISYGVFNTDTHKLVWEKKFTKNQYKISCAANPSTLFIQINNRRLMAHRLENGELIFNKEFITKKDLISVNNLLLCESEPGILSAFNAADLQPVWKCDTKSSVIEKKFSVSSKNLYPFIIENVLYGINLKDGKILYKTNLKINQANAIRRGNMIYIGGRTIIESVSYSGKIYAISVKTGKIKWERESKNHPAYYFTIIDNLLLVNSADPYSIIALNRKNGNIVWKKTMPDSIVSAPDIRGNQLFIKTDYYICSIDKKGNPIFTFNKKDYTINNPSIHIIPSGFILHNGNAKCYVRGEEELRPEEISKLIEEVKKRKYYAAEEVKKLSVSRNPQAINFLLSLLNDPSADQYVNRIAYRFMASTGVKSVIKTLLKARDTNRTMIPIQQRLVIEDVTANRIGEYIDGSDHVYLIAAQKDSTGVLWGLMRLGIAGNRSDRWISQWKDGKWQSFKFTGETVRQKDDNWFKRYVGNKRIISDTDKDGLTDLIEQRFGTSTNKADSDRDGLDDSTDKNPLTAPRKLNETEKVMAAAFEGYFNKFSKHTDPIIVEFPDKIQPFELFGSDGIILPERQVKDKPILKMLGEGTESFKFIAPSSDINGNILDEDKKDFHIEWNKNRTEAIVGFVNYTGPLVVEGGNIRLRKIDGVWFVIHMTIGCLA